MKKSLGEILIEGCEEALQYWRHKNQGTIIEVSMRNYRWAKDRWPGRTVHVTTYEGADTLSVLRPGFLYNSKCRRRIKIDNETLKRETERTNLTTTHPKLVPKRGS